MRTPARSSKTCATSKFEFIAILSAADQSTVDVRHREELRRVDCLNAAAVKNARPGADFSIPGRQLRADESMHLLGLFGAGVASGADGPDGLVGEDGLGECLDTGELQHRFELPRDDLVGALPLA